MTSTTDLVRSLKEMSARETRHLFDVGDYWNACEAAADALEEAEQAKTWLREESDSRAKRLLAAELSRDEWKQKAKDLEQEVASRKLLADDVLRHERDEWKAKAEKMIDAARKLRVMSADEMENGKPFWVVPCDSYEPLKAALAALGLASGKEGGE